MLLRLAYLGITNAFTLLRLLPGRDRDKDIEILSLRHQLAVLQRQLDGQQVRFAPVDRAWLAALLHPLPRPTLRRLRLLVQPDTILKWHRDLIARRHAAASRPGRHGRPRTLRSIRALVLRLARENSGWGVSQATWRTAHARNQGRPVHRLGDLREAGIDPALERATTTWTDFLRSQAHAKRWVRTCRRELLDRTLIWNQRHLLHALREYERFYNRHRPHQGIANVRPLKPLPEPITDPDQFAKLNIHRHDRLGGVLHEYEHAA